MKRKLLFSGVLFALALAGCGVDSEYAYLFDLPNRAGGDPNSPQGVWRLDGSTESREIRAEVGADYILLAGRCSSGGRTVIAGQKVSATVTATSVSHTEDINARKMDGDFGCQLNIPAGTYTYQIRGGRAVLARIGASFTKIADLKDIKK